MMSLEIEPRFFLWWESCC